LAQIDTTLIKIARILPNFIQSGPVSARMANLDAIYRILTIIKYDNSELNVKSTIWQVDVFANEIL
jgi:hypothetical protein